VVVVYLKPTLSIARVSIDRPWPRSCAGCSAGASCSVDAPNRMLKLTDEGHRVLRSAEPSSRAIDARVLSALPSARRDEFVSTLSALVAALEEMAANPK
jgi:hypothetical protein